MKLFNIDDSKEFFNVVNECKDKVDLVTKDGSHFPELQLAFHNREDLSKVLAYAMDTKYLA